MASQRDQIRKKAIEILKDNPRGMRWMEMLRALYSEFPNTPKNSISGATYNLYALFPEKVYKPSRGVWKFRGADEPIDQITPVSPKALKEDDFYASFADWLKNELGECTEAVAFGGNALSRKWGTPDVIGIYRPNKRDVVQFHPEVISAEVKISPYESVTAFGQAIAYRLFSSKVYVVQPNTATPEDLDRLEALCLLFGVGLVLFSPDVTNPDFTIRTRAQRYVPDMFWVNEFADKLYTADKEVFNKLFG